MILRMLAYLGIREGERIPAFWAAIFIVLLPCLGFMFVIWFTNKIEGTKWEPIITVGGLLVILWITIFVATERR